MLVTLSGAASLFLSVTKALSVEPTITTPKLMEVLSAEMIWPVAKEGTNKARNKSLFIC